ncbi:MAG: dihydropteroate synthase [Lachnospiraceae bacterium]|nr:dihydropteroate synthase [Lachnospiraceae bacterium]
MRIGSREFDVENETYVMGILNVTPDSFSDGGKWDSMDRALRHVEEMLEEGMDILDIGGESTRPGQDYSMPAQEELERVLPYIEAVKARFDVPISLDTYKSQVAEAGIAAGVDLINDIWGLKWDPEMARVIAERGVACCLMHNRRETGAEGNRYGYGDFLEDVKADLARSAGLAREAGIAGERIILDPGVGFAKSYEQNLEILHHLEYLRALGYPILLGTSRKSVVGLTLDLPVTERLEGTLATTVLGVLKGCAFVRVHDVKENARAIRMTRAIMRAGG